MLNKSKGQMYPWVSHTWNTVAGACPHKCTYCYMIPFAKKPVHLSEANLKDNLGAGNYIFVGSGCDMWADEIPREWIQKTLTHCCLFHSNKYLFQTKNPKRIMDYKDYLPLNTLIGITYESNIDHPVSDAPLAWNRLTWAGRIRNYFPVMISMEPILEFDLSEVLAMLKTLMPKFVSIGADSKGHKMPEPSEIKVRALIESLTNAGIKVLPKANLKRLIGKFN